MFKSALSTFAAATFLFGITCSAPAETIAAPSQTGSRPAATELAAVVCGGNGCAPVQTKAQNGKRKFQTLGHG